MPFSFGHFTLGHFITRSDCQASVQSLQVSPTAAPSSSAVKRFQTLPVRMKHHFIVCEQAVGKPLTRDEAEEKLESNPAFRAMAQMVAGNDLVQNAIGLDFGSRLRSCVEESQGVRNHNNHSFN